MKFVPSFLWLLAASGFVFAQETSAPPPVEQSTGAASQGSAAATSETLDYIYNRSPEDSSAAGIARDQAVESKTMAMSKQGALESLAGMESLLSPDFERFLSAPEVTSDELTEYAASVNAVLAALRERKPGDAFEGLGQMAEHPCDGDLSLQIANRVRAVWDSSATTRAIVQRNADLETQIERSNWNVDLAAQSIKRNSQGGSSKNIAKGQVPNAGEVVGGAAPGLAGTMRMTHEYFQSVDAKARVKLNEVRMGEIHTKAKADLEEYVSTLMQARQFLHARVAAEFYQTLFRDGELPPSLAKLSTGAIEARRKIASAVEVFKFKAEQGQLVSGTEILKEAFALSETTPEMLGLERTFKLRVVELANSIRKMRNLIEAREYGDLGQVLSKLEGQVSDLDTTKPRQLIRVAQLEARMRLGNAKLATQSGDQSKALAEFKAAAQIWPGNPELTELSDKFFQTQDVANQSVTEFDRLNKEGDFRRIAEKQLLYANALANDDARLKHLKTALEIVQRTQASIEKAKIYQQNNDPAGAWEQVELAARDWNDDNELNRLRTEYAKPVAEFVALLDRGEVAEEKKEYGFGLSCFLQAQQVYPGSQLAHGAIERLSKKLISSDETDGEKKPTDKSSEPSGEHQTNDAGESPAENAAVGDA